jgi:hypothetical protein
MAHANAVLRQRVEEYRLEREDGLVQVQHEMQNLESLGQLALNLTVASAADEDGTFVPAKRPLLEPTPDPNELVQQPESGPCGFEYSGSPPEQWSHEAIASRRAVGDLERPPSMHRRHDFGNAHSTTVLEIAHWISCFHRLAGEH